MNDSDLEKIILGLIEKSKKREVNWFHSSEIEPIVSPDSDDFIVNLEKSTINIFLNETDRSIIFNIMNSRGKNIIQKKYEPNSLYYSKLETLLSLAANKADNIDETIESIKDELNSSGEIGHLKEDDEIPF